VDCNHCSTNDITASLVTANDINVSGSIVSNGLVVTNLTLDNALTLENLTVKNSFVLKSGNNNRLLMDTTKGGNMMLTNNSESHTVYLQADTGLNGYAKPGSAFFGLGPDGSLPTIRMSGNTSTVTGGHISLFSNTDANTASIVLNGQTGALSASAFNVVSDASRKTNIVDAS
jgi:hypothetical protein